MNYEKSRNELATHLANAGVNDIKGLLDLMYDEINKRDYFDEDKFVNWFKEKNIAFMNTPRNFIYKCAVPDIRNGRFDLDRSKPTEKRISFVSTILSMREEGFDMNKHDDMYFDIYYNWLLEQGCTLDELCYLHKQIVIYLVRNDMKSSKAYIECLKKSKFVRERKAPIEELDREVIQANKEWDDLIAKIESIAPKGSKVDTAMSLAELEEYKAKIQKESEI